MCGEEVRAGPLGDRRGGSICQLALETQSDRAQSSALAKSQTGGSFHLPFAGPAQLPNPCLSESTRIRTGYVMCGAHGKTKNKSLVIHK